LVCGAVHRVHGVVHGEHGAGHVGVGLNERLQAAAHHVGGESRHAEDVDGKIGHGHLVHVADAVADAFGCVADALQVGVDLDDTQDETEIDSHGLLHGEQVEGGLVDVAFEAVDGELAAADQIANGEVTHTIRLNGPLNGLLGQAGHDQQLLF
jgi:hypothetical protein